MNKKTKIVMITMFKNEASVIRKMLESSYKYIDYWIFQNNGSTDGTPEVVEEFFKEHPVPGFIYEVEEGWVSFGWNRDHLLQRCLQTDHGCDWIMKMDCDEYMEVDENFDWSVFDDTTIQSFHVPAIAPGTTYYRAWIWNSKLPWKFNHSLAHETITLQMDGIGENFHRYNLPLSFRHINTNKGESYLSPTKYVSDALKLEEEMIRENTFLSDMYHFWYIGKSYYDARLCGAFPLGDSQKQEFTKRCIYYFYEFVCHKYPEFRENNLAPETCELSYFALYCCGVAYGEMGDVEKSILHFNLAGRFCPRRNEHLVRLAEICINSDDYGTGLQILNKLVSPERKNPFPDWIFLIENECYYDTGTYVQDLRQRCLEVINQ